MTTPTSPQLAAFLQQAATNPRPTQPDDADRLRARTTAPRPVPTTEDRMRDARTDRSFATYLDATERDQLDARAACAEAERDDALADRDTARAEAANLRRELDKANAGRQKHHSELDTMTQVAQSNKRHVTYLTAVIEAIANVEPHIHNGDTTEDNCSPYCPGCRIRTAMNATPPSSVPPRRAQEDHAQGYAEAVARLRDDARYMHWWSSTGVQPDGPLRQHLADYLETVGPEVKPAAQDAETVRRLLDQAIESALPQAGGNVRALLKALLRELKRVDVKRAEHAEREG